MGLTGLKSLWHQGCPSQGPQGEATRASPSFEGLLESLGLWRSLPCSKLLLPLPLSYCWL